MERELMIDALVEDDLIAVADYGAEDWLRYILMNGFKGYSNMTRDELETEYYERELDVDSGDSMDGDLESGLASAGWGTDEDYGYYGSDE